MNTTSAFAAPGDLDLDFGTEGKVTTSMGGTDAASAVAVSVENKVLVTGEALSGSGSYDFAVARFNGDGSLDSTFDGDGKVTTDFGKGDFGSDLVVHPGGKTTVAGTTTFGGQYDFALARYNGDGSLDGTFDGDGKVVTDLGGAEQANSVAFSSDAKAIVAGSVNRFGGKEFVLARYNGDGSLDNTFDGDGIVTTNFGGSDVAFAVASDADGKIVAAGSSDASLALARYNGDGSLDNTFGGDGKVTTALGERSFTRGMTIQSDGRIVVSGASDLDARPDFGNDDVALARYNPDGSLDTSFDGDGTVTTSLGSGSDIAEDLAVDAAGNLVVAAYGGDSRFTVLRYKSDGSLDAGFGSNGKVTGVRSRSRTKRICRIGPTMRARARAREARAKG